MSTRVAAVILAGGRGSRLENEVNKVFLQVQEREVLEYSVETFARTQQVTELVVVGRREDHGRIDSLLVRLALATPVTVVVGGATRHQSEQAALACLAPRVEAGVVDLVAIHDAARPFMTTSLLQACIGGAERRGGAIPGLAPESPLYREDRGRAVPIPGGAVIRAQTPQVFAARPLLAAYRAAAAAGTEGVDTAETAVRFGSMEVVVVPGDERNLKITFVEDLFRAEELALLWKEGSWTA